MQLTLTSSDDQSFQVDCEIAKRVGIIEDFVTDSDDTDTKPVTVPLPKVNGDTLKRVIEWLEMHKNDPEVEEEEVVTKEEGGLNPIAEADEKFFKDLDQKAIFELTNAASYLGIKGLLAVCCKTIANKIRAKALEEIRAMFGIDRDYTPEEEEQLRREKSWCED